MQLTAFSLLFIVKLPTDETLQLNSSIYPLKTKYEIKGITVTRKNNTNAKKNKSTPEIVAQKIIEQIETGTLSPGQKLPPQSDLAKSFTVGTSSIREAVNVLEIMGYLEVAHGRGMFVKKELPLNTSVISTMEENLAGATVYELFELRELLECHVTGIASRRIDRNGIRKLQKALELMRQCVGERKAFIDADIEFHVTIAESVKFTAVGAIVRMIHELMHKNIDLAVEAQTVLYGKDAMETAEQIVNHIILGEEFNAVRCMRNHLDLPRKAIVKIKTIVD